MFALFRTAALAFCAASLGCPTGTNPGGSDVGKNVHTLTVGDEERETIVYVPESVAEDTLVPAVLMLHGTTGNGERFYNDSGWKEKADEEGFIAVFPSALTHCYFEDNNNDGDFDDNGERSVTTKWAAAKLGDPETMPLCDEDDLSALAPGQRRLADHPLADDLAFFDALLDFLVDNYPVDEKRIYASGFSNGGEMTSHLARERSERFGALSASAGTLFGEPRPAAWPISFVFTLGADDAFYTVPYGVDPFPVSETLFDEVPALTGAIVRDYLVLTQLENTFTYSEEVVEKGDNTRTIGRFEFTSSPDDNGNIFRFLILENLPHRYPSDNNDFMRIADPLWEFFSDKSAP